MNPARFEKIFSWAALFRSRLSRLSPTFPFLAAVTSIERKGAREMGRKFLSSLERKSSCVYWMLCDDGRKDEAGGCGMDFLWPAALRAPLSSSSLVDTRLQNTHKGRKGALSACLPFLPFGSGGGGGKRPEDWTHTNQKEWPFAFASFGTSFPSRHGVGGT